MGKRYNCGFLCGVLEYGTDAHRTQIHEILNDDNLFFEVIQKVQEKIQTSANYVQTPIDELELCVNILVVDAFIRCKIFENPENYNYATT